MPYHLHDCSVLHCIKSLGKIKFENDNFPLALLALMYKFKTPGNTVLDCSTFNKTILILMQDLKDDFLQSFS